MGRWSLASLEQELVTLENAADALSWYRGWWQRSRIDHEFPIDAAVSVSPFDRISKLPQPPSARSGSGKPPLPLSARKLVVGVPTPRTGRNGATTPRSAIKPGDLPKVVIRLASRTAT
jgi:hypothetical protein